DVEALTRRVLERVERGTRAQVAARQTWEQRGPEVSAGNGSVMYCAPLGVALAGRADAFAALEPEAPTLSRLTHHDGRCPPAVLAVTLAVAGLTRGEGAPRAGDRALRRT